jgi:CheY-like chemotaxis protein
MARILMVDDEPRLREGMAEYLEHYGHEVRVATNGLEAVKALRDFSADVVVTDINMPDMDGIELVMALRETSSGIGVIAISGGGLFEKGMLLDSASALGADVTLQKPLDLDQLREAIDRLSKGRPVTAGGA